ncbi:MAG: hypothetical protein SF187_24195 [Deltaproteobacteria bacterium]|nr:hypothetical protein [Deltaproteobacteria bacterium]
MSHPKPPQIEAAFEDFRKHLAQVEGPHLDPLVAPFAEMEPGIIKMLGGAFNIAKPEHRIVAFMVGATFAMRLEKDVNAFWFPNRSSGFGAAMGLVEAVGVVSPIEAASRALARGQLSELDDLYKDLRAVVARATLSPEAVGLGGQRLQPQDYQRLFDPGLAQVACLDTRAVQTLLATPVNQARRDIEDAISRAAQLPDPVKTQIRAQIGGALGQMDPDKALAEQLPRSTSLCELLAWIHGARASSGLAPEELWRELVVPLLHIGAAETFPALDAEEVAQIEPGSDPLLLYVDIVPFATPAADEDGVIGVFPVESAESVVPMEEGFPRLVKVDPSALEVVLAKFDPTATRTSVEKFRAHVVAAGAPEPGPIESPLFEAALSLIDDLATVSKSAKESGGVFCVRRATEAEASSEAALHLVRQSLQAPRIILA